MSSLSKKQFTLILGIAVAFVVCFVCYFLYEKIESQISATDSVLTATQNALMTLEASTTLAIKSQANLIASQKQSLAQNQSNQTELQTELQSFQSSTLAAQKSFVTNVNKIAPSVVKLVCRGDSKGALQEGSGVLYSSDIAKEPYFIQTNLHVASTTDGSPSSCAIAIYPDYTNSSLYYAFSSNGLQQPIAGADVAFVAPQIIDGSNAGTVAELAQYSLSSDNISFCQNQKVGDHLSVLGYPAVGGQTLTVTDGIVSGFDTSGGFQFITTSAKIDKGNSGGIAIEDNGCVLGIPTFIEADANGSIGRILDLGNIFKSSTPQ